LKKTNWKLKNSSSTRPWVVRESSTLVRHSSATRPESSASRPRSRPTSSKQSSENTKFGPNPSPNPSFNVSFSFEIKIVVHSSLIHPIHWIHFLLWRKIETSFSERERLKTNKFIQTHSFLWFLFSFTKKLNHCTFECTLCVPFFIIKKKGFDFEIFHLNCFLNFFSRPKTKTKNQSTFQNVIFNQYRQDLKQFQKTGIIAAEQCNSIANHSIAILLWLLSNVLFLFYICCFFIMVNHQNFSKGLLKSVRQRIQLNLYCEIHSSFIDLHLFKSHSLSNRHSMRFKSFPTIVIETSFPIDLSS
jgi:hypothetical protein